MSLLIALSFGILTVLFFSALFSGAETGILSCSSLKVRNQSSQGDPNARILEKMLNKKTSVILTLVLGTNLCNTLYSLLGEKFLGRLFQPFGIEISIFLQSLLLLPVLIVTAEIFPKSLFRHYAFSLTLQAAPFLAPIHIILLPIALPFQWVSKWIMGSGLPVAKYNRETLNLLMEYGIQSGGIQSNQERLLRHILGLSRVKSFTLAQSIEDLPLLSPTSTPAQLARTPALKNLKVVALGEKSASGIVPMNRLWAIPQNSPIANLSALIPRISHTRSGLKALDHLLKVKQEYGLVVRDGKIRGFLSLSRLMREA